MGIPPLGDQSNQSRIRKVAIIYRNSRGGGHVIADAVAGYGHILIFAMGTSIVIYVLPGRPLGTSHIRFFHCKRNLQRK